MGSHMRVLPPGTLSPAAAPEASDVRSSAGSERRSSRGGSERRGSSFSEGGERRPSKDFAAVNNVLRGAVNSVKTKLRKRSTAEFFRHTAATSVSGECDRREEVPVRIYLVCARTVDFHTGTRCVSR